jgi:3-hydroxyacyl-CoA dehydrogenase
VKYAKIADKLCELGRFGQKTGMGWYRYEPARATPFPIRWSTS